MEGKPDKTPTGKSTGLPFPFSRPQHPFHPAAAYAS
jgi:hypothetical protein